MARSKQNQTLNNKNVLIGSLALNVVFIVVALILWEIIATGGTNRYSQTILHDIQNYQIENYCDNPVGFQKLLNSARGVDPQFTSYNHKLVAYTVCGTGMTQSILQQITGPIPVDR